MNLLERIRSDFVYTAGLLAILRRISDISTDSDNLVPDDFERVADAHGDNIAIIFEGADLTYRTLEERANKFANWAISQGLRQGDCAALFMENCADYIAFWLGMTKIGVRTALINNQLKGHSLAHCIDIAEAKLLVMNSNQISLYETATDDLKSTPEVWVLGEANEFYNDLDGALEPVSALRPDKSRRKGVSGRDVALYIYTSGTTGLPKAARMTHARCQSMMRSLAVPTKMGPSDRVFLTLPLYHATGGLVGVGSALTTGAALILERKFSASSFWKSATEQGATAFVYIGEMCRYIMNAPVSEYERRHSIVKCFGNGLRGDVWRAMTDRTGIKRVYEFYGATEGNVSLINLDSKVGAIGRIPPILKKTVTTRFIRVDLNDETPLRGEDGFCMPVEPNEPGEAIGLISAQVARTRFEGYRDKEQNKSKILNDVFEAGDTYFRTGDLMRLDEDGYIYFVDRMGDTFRWKAENASTNEVSEVLSQVKGVELANVYGVAVTGHEGKAGMAALTVTDDFSLEAVWRAVSAELPEYARPVFLRIRRAVETTGTFKFVKTELVAQGYDPAKIDEPLYVADVGTDQYILLTPQTHSEIESGARRL